MGTPEKLAVVFCCALLKKNELGVPLLSIPSTPLKFVILALTQLSLLVASKEIPSKVLESQLFLLMVLLLHEIIRSMPS